MLHGHGDDLYRSDREIIANFSTNVWYGGNRLLLTELLAKNADSIFHYPEPDAGSFRKAVARYHQVNEENVLVGNGATELFYLTAHAFAGADTLIPVPSFREYEDACVLFRHMIEFLPYGQIQRLPNGKKLLLICNPNNPDGRIWTKKEIEKILEKFPEMVVLVDESFIHFAPEVNSMAEEVLHYKNLLVVRSLTKCYAIPGLRLGYMLGDKTLIRLLTDFKQPWSVNALAIEVGKYLLESGEKELPDADLLLQRQKCFSARLAEIPGFCPQESHTSFFLVRTVHHSGALKQYLLERHGLLIRDASNFRGLDNHYFRINTLREDKNNLLLIALREYVG